MNEFENKRWLVIPVSLLDTINFNEVLDNSKDNLRYNIDNTKVVIKYYITEILEDIVNKYIDFETHEEKEVITKKGIYGRPTFYSDEYQEYTHSEILSLLSTDEWNNKNISN